MKSGKFLQSEEWENFQQSLGRKTRRVGNVLIIKMPLPFGFSYLYSPKTENRIQKIENRIIEIAKKEKAIFWRVEPPEMPDKNYIKSKDIQPANTLITDISKSEDELLKAMHPKTRYNIRLAARKGILITNYELQIADKAFAEFYSLLKQTAIRQGIKIHSENYYKKLAGFNNIFIARLNDTPLACAMVNFYEGTATYLHGGSDEEYKNMMAPNLLHWEIIKTAKSRGCRFYDWWGVDEKKWPGVTRFKMGFGGKVLCAPGTYDLPLDKFWYWIYKLFRR